MPSCGEDGHFARDCPEPRKEGGGGENSGECYNCGEMGHNKADCVNPRVEREFTGECRDCGQTGHRASDCPLKPAPRCKACGEEGHSQTGCEVNRITHGVATMKGEDAWSMFEKADKERDVNDIKKVRHTHGAIPLGGCLLTLYSSTGPSGIREGLPGLHLRAA